MLRGVLLFFLFFSTVAAHAIEIAFFIRYRADGTLERYEANSPYTHVAIRIGDQWLEARPYYGVHLTSDVSDMGHITEILYNPDIPEPDESFLSEVLRKKYFIFADWHNPEVFNCTKLVAKFLDVEPNPMDFDPAMWGDRFHEYLGKPGLSVGELYDELRIERSYGSKVSKPCLKALASLT